MTKTLLPHDYPPMEAKTVEKIPQGDHWIYEPKWDGFRCIAFKEDGVVDLRSKSGQPLGRYFPEIVAACEKLKAENFVIDGELIVHIGKSLSFDALLQRIHPAESRVKKLAKETPATFVVFDQLVSEEGDVLIKEHLPERKKVLKKFAEKHFKNNSDFVLCPSTDMYEAAQDWLANPRSFLDGIIAKRDDMPYQSGNKTGMFKIKRLKTADCVVGGFRYGSGSKKVGSLLLGLYDENGDLHHVGFSSGFTSLRERDLTAKLEALKTDQSFTANIPGGPSRWSTERSTEWVPVKPELVVEVRFDHVSDGRFRHGTKAMRWRPDKDPKKCTLDQMA